MIRYLAGVVFLSMCLPVPAVTAQTPQDCRRKEVELQRHPVLISLIPCDYVKEYRPPHDPDKPVQVEFNMFIQDINSINAADMDFRVDLFLHMRWEDSRLKLDDIDFIRAQNTDDYITLPSYSIDYIWTPDPYITNSKDASITRLTTTYSSVTIYRNHTVRYSARVYSIVACQMEFREYPMDIQICPMSLQSFMYTKNEVEFTWRSWAPVTINKELKLLQFSLTKPLKNYLYIPSDDEIGHDHKDVQQLVVEFQFSRVIGHHLVQTFVPSFLMVSLSWFSFWLGLEAIPGRVTLLVTSLLTLTTLFTGIKEGLPQVAYVKAIDVWMAGCLVFHVSALGEFVVVRVLNVMHQSGQVHPSPLLPSTTTVHPIHRTPAASAKYEQQSEYLHRVAVLSNGTTDKDEKPLPANNKLTPLVNPQGERNTEIIGVRPRTALAWDLENGVMRSPNQRFALSWIDSKTGQKKLLWKEIDKASRIVFPLMFLLFMLIFFPILLSRAF